MTLPYGGLNPSGHIICRVCKKVIAYDASTSWWLDDTGIPGCTPDEEGNVLQHDPSDWLPESALKD